MAGGGVSRLGGSVVVRHLALNKWAEITSVEVRIVFLGPSVLLKMISNDLMNLRVELLANCRGVRGTKRFGM